ncbi:MAG: hypothetical protein K2M91_13380 [Lachnospiraceae bacterium]|nr:hypothetical protein [Lachnospiraceae bacterium]
MEERQRAAFFSVYESKGGGWRSLECMRAMLEGGVLRLCGAKSEGGVLRSVWSKVMER